MIIIIIIIITLQGISVAECAGSPPSSSEFDWRQLVNWSPSTSNQTMNPETHAGPSSGQHAESGNGGPSGRPWHLGPISNSNSSDLQSMRKFLQDLQEGDEVTSVSPAQPGPQQAAPQEQEPIPLAPPAPAPEPIYLNDDQRKNELSIRYDSLGLFCGKRNYFEIKSQLIEKLVEIEKQIELALLEDGLPREWIIANYDKLRGFLHFASPSYEGKSQSQILHLYAHAKCNFRS